MGSIRQIRAASRICARAIRGARNWRWGVGSIIGRKELWQRTGCRNLYTRPRTPAYMLPASLPPRMRNLLLNISRLILTLTLALWLGGIAALTVFTLVLFA